MSTVALRALAPGAAFTAAQRFDAAFSLRSTTLAECLRRLREGDPDTNGAVAALLGGEDGVGLHAALLLALALGEDAREPAEVRPLQLAGGLQAVRRRALRADGAVEACRGLAERALAALSEAAELEPRAAAAAVTTAAAVPKVEVPAAEGPAVQPSAEQSSTEQPAGQLAEPEEPAAESAAEDAAVPDGESELEAAVVVTAEKRREPEALMEAISAHDLPGLRRAIGAAHDLNAPDEQGLSALHMACTVGDASAATLLIQGGADIDARTRAGNTALHICARNSWLSCVSVLLANSCRRNERGSGGKTPLQVAGESGHETVTSFLLARAGVKAFVPDSAGRSPLASVRYFTPDRPIGSREEERGCALRIAAEEWKRLPYRERYMLSSRQEALYAAEDPELPIAWVFFGNDNISGQPASLMFFASSQLYMKEIGCRGVISGDAIVVDAFEELSCANSNILVTTSYSQTLREVLADRNRVRSGSFGLRQAAALVLEVLSQLAQLHRNGIAQGHVTPENIVVLSHGRWSFRCHNEARIKLPAERTSHGRPYDPPAEPLSMQELMAADLWSLGALLVEVLTAQPLNVASLDEDAYAAMLASTGGSFDHRLHALVFGMLEFDPAARLTAAQALEDPLFRNQGAPPRWRLPPVALSAMAPRLCFLRALDSHSAVHACTGPRLFTLLPAVGSRSQPENAMAALVSGGGFKDAAGWRSDTWRLHQLCEWGHGHFVDDADRWGIPVSKPKPLLQAMAPAVVVNMEMLSGTVLDNTPVSLPDEAICRDLGIPDFEIRRVLRTGAVLDVKRFLGLVFKPLAAEAEQHQAEYQASAEDLGWYGPTDADLPAEAALGESAAQTAYVAAVRAYEQFIASQDPMRTNSGLYRVETQTGQHCWLCANHARLASGELHLDRNRDASARQQTAGQARF